MLARQKFAHHLTDDGRPAKTAARKDFESKFSRGTAHDVYPDIMDQRSGAILGRSRYRNLEFARKVGELGMERRPLPDDLAPGPRILEFIRGNSRKMIRGGIADAVAAGLNGVHLDGREFSQYVGHLLELRPVVLNVLAGGEMSGAAIVAPRNPAQRAQLYGGQQAVGDGDAQHRRMALNVQAIPQTQMPKFIVIQFAVEEAPRLIPKLGDSLVDQRFVDRVISIHRPAS